MEQARQMALQRPPDLLLCATAHSAWRQLPVLLLTGDTGPDRLREAAATGIALLHRPVAPGQLYRELSSALGATVAVRGVATG